MTALLQVASIVLLVVLLHVPLGDYMARVYCAPGHWRVERVMYRLIGAQPDDQQRWTKYAHSVLAFSAMVSCQGPVRRAVRWRCSVCTVVPSTATEIWRVACTAAARVLQKLRDSLASRIVTDLGLASDKAPRLRQVIEQETSHVLRAMRTKTFGPDDEEGD